MRIFIIEQDGSITHIPVRKFDGMCGGRERCPEYAGRRMRYVLVSVESENRKPVRIFHMDCGFISFTEAGKRDEREVIKQMRLAAEMIEPFPQEGNSVSIGPALAQQRNLREFSWMPTATEQAEIERAVFQKRGKRMKLRFLGRR